MRIAIYQCHAITADVPANLSRLGVMARKAKLAGADLIVVPEMYLTGYDIGPATVQILAEARDGASAQAVADIARDVGIAVLYGYPERGENDQVFNSVQLVDRRGYSAANYRKSHLFGPRERAIFAIDTAGPAVLDFEGWRLGILICYDVEFPESMRALALAGADIVVVPTANMLPYEIVATMVVPTRAYENQVYVAYINYCGYENEIHYCGLSCVSSPNGTDVVRASQSEGLIVCDINREQLVASRQQFPYLTDRRPDLYSAQAGDRIADNR